MQLAEKQEQKQTVFDVETQQIYYSTGSGLIPILSPSDYYPLTHLQKNNMLSISELLNSENNGILQENNGIATVILQQPEQKTDGQLTENSQTNDGNFTRNLRKLNSSLTEKRAAEIIQEHNLKLFSQNFVGKIKELSETIENTAIAILYNTTKQPTIDKTRLEFRKASELAAKNKDIELEKVLRILEARLAAQNKIAKMNQTITKKANSKRTKILVLVCIIVTVGILALGRQIYIGLAGASAPHSTGTEITKIYTQPEILEIIDLYEAQNNVKIWEFRRQLIITDFQNIELTESQAVQIIDNRVKELKK
jgi:hypothetical protein